MKPFHSAMAYCVGMGLLKTRYMFYLVARRTPRRALYSSLRRATQEAWPTAGVFVGGNFLAPRSDSAWRETWKRSQRGWHAWKLR